MVFDQLFRVDDPRPRAARGNQLDRKASILDQVKDQARELEKKLGKDDRATRGSIFHVDSRCRRAHQDRPRLGRSRAAQGRPDRLRQDAPSHQAELNDDGSGMKRYLRLIVRRHRAGVPDRQHARGRPLSQGRGRPDLQGPDQVPLRLPHPLPSRRRPGEIEVLDGGRSRLHGALGLLPGQAQEHQGRPGNAARPHDGRLGNRPRRSGARAQRTCRSCSAAAAGLGVKHQGHLAKKDMWVGSVWQTMLDRLGMPRPGTPEQPFQAGRSNGVITEVL